MLIMQKKKKKDSQGMQLAFCDVWKTCYHQDLVISFNASDGESRSSAPPRRRAHLNGAAEGSSAADGSSAAAAATPTIVS